MTATLVSGAYRAADVLSTFGVNTHIGSARYADPAELVAKIQYLGIENVRQPSPGTAEDVAAFAYLASHGLRMDYLINGNGPVDLADNMARLQALAPSISAIEGPNEVNIWPITYAGLGGIAAAAQLQRDLYTAVKADPVLASIPVYLFTVGGANPADVPGFGDLSAYADYANLHAYAPDGIQPLWSIPAAIEGGRTGAPSDPVVVTETNYYTLPSNTDWGGVPERVQAAFVLDTLLDNAKAGVAATYLYHLIDDVADPSGTDREAHFGLFRHDGTAKPAADALHNLTSLLADPGAGAHAFQPVGLAYKASGLPYGYTGDSMLFEKSDGTRIVAVWNEEKSWDPATQTALPLSHHAVSLDLGAVFGTVRIYDPLVGSAPIAVKTGVSSVQLDLTDHPLLVEIPGGASASAPPSAFAPASLTLGSGGDRILIRLSQDAWQGSAQYTVAVDGHQIGGVLTASALHASGQSDTVAVLADLAPGAHSVSVSFLNDACGGTASTDRNLYVDAVSLDGTAIAGGSAALLWNSHAEFAMAKPDVAPATLTVGSGADTLLLRLSQDAWQGSAQYTVAVDGHQVGGVLTASALHAAGQSDLVSVRCDLAPGAHTLSLAFVNDAYGGTAGTDRNLFLDGVSLDGAPVDGAARAFYAAGSADIAVTKPAFAPATLSAGSGAHSLVLKMSQDYWNGAAHYAVAVDGVRIGGTFETSALHAAGQSDTLTLHCDLGAGPHRLTVSFLDDACGPAGDRNLYLDGLTLDGTPVEGAARAFMGNGAADFAFA